MLGLLHDDLKSKLLPAHLHLVRTLRSRIARGANAWDLKDKEPGRWAQAVVEEHDPKV